ncbi:unnamed protein product [Bursaphelenchus okinawaensis]|uniref:C6 domain-containing protein n=1 Tax=Bursaphelenchus okinawaensis TaxID=465554 RepID=A0A811JQ21_9BILA|nr:unnamed protein product [Bursaphelenchus okinawaensis]CAG9077553.1 unnamed protein product [Bursaphelenchus okinawaensis]
MIVVKLVGSCTSTVNHLAPTPPTPMGCMACPTSGLDLFLRTNAETDNADGCKQLTLYCAAADQDIYFNEFTIVATETGQITLQCGAGGWMYMGQVVTEMDCLPPNGK